MFRDRDGVLRPLITFYLLVIFPYICLISAYFAFGEPLWIKEIDWLEKLTNPRLTLFFLEMLTLTLVVITFSIIKLPKILRERRLSRLKITDYLVVVFFLLVTLVYALIKIIEGDNPGVRLFYALFSAFLLVFWFYNASYILARSRDRLFKILRKLDESPSNVFSYGRQLSYSINSASLSVIWLLVPIISWLPTLLSGVVSPKDIAFYTGIIVCLLLFILPVYAQIKLSNVLNTSLKIFDEYIADEIVRLPTSKEDSERIKALIDLRESLTKSIKFSTQEFIVSIVQYSTIITALIATAKI